MGVDAAGASVPWLSPGAAGNRIRRPQFPHDSLKIGGQVPTGQDRDQGEPGSRRASSTLARRSNRAPPPPGPDVFCRADGGLDGLYPKEEEPDLGRGGPQRGPCWATGLVSGSLFSLFFSLSFGPRPTPKASTTDSRQASTWLARLVIERPGFGDPDRLAGGQICKGGG